MALLSRILVAQHVFLVLLNLGMRQIGEVILVAVGPIGQRHVLMQFLQKVLGDEAQMLIVDALEQVRVSVHRVQLLLLL